MIKPGKGNHPVLQRWLAGLVIGAALLAGLRGIAKDIEFDRSLLGQAFVADAGWTQSVPVEVVEARELLARHDPGRRPIALDRSLWEDPLVRERLWDGLYPRRVVWAENGLMLFRTTAAVPDHCTDIARSERIVLVDCP
ncbi:hypothetical protein [Stenotrophomonas sp. AB1(2024)]|uniref:hypothetical protein n=1 Tax=Stenotrophomonas sp. AB1(2024) TaxID=3132215 RepID=UPI0030B631A1